MTALIDTMLLITIIITLSHIIFNIFHDGMTDKIIVLKNCLINKINYQILEMLGLWREENQ